MFVVRKNGNGVALAWIDEEPCFGLGYDTVFSGSEDSCILYLIENGFRYSMYHDYWLWLSDDDEDDEEINRQYNN